MTYIINVFNAVNADLISGKWTSIQPDVQKIVNTELGYLNTLAELPATIIKTDTAAIAQLAADLSLGGSSSATTTSSAVKATTLSASPTGSSVVSSSTTGTSTLLNDVINVASLPVQNLATAWTDVAQLTYVLNVFNAVNADLVSGKWTSIQPDVQKILTTEQGYLTTLAELPSTIVKTDTAAISKLAADLGISTNSASTTTSSAKVATVNTAAINTADTKAADTSTSTTDNKITALASKLKSAAPTATPKSRAASASVDSSTTAPSISGSIHAIAGKLAGGKAATDSSASDTSGTSGSSSNPAASGSSDAKPAGRHHKG
ncbi:hypothetical protein [Mycolicibacterium frederiksbergense]|uniref:hypothetical protein n=1 Tax=Mycolicibacterium frederiksbergense TaxID=117567 RepID=UPI002473F9A4|nr:hypothetical protein [Mycolicibacterium frederiksbergense]